MSLATYIHLPFCRVRCTYCPFAISTDLSREGEYFDALIAEIESDPLAAEMSTLYFGGGTPSRSSPAQLRRLTAALCAKFTLRDDAEFTIEANPEDVDDEFIALARELGVNRVSIGVQSLSDAELVRIGRRHGAPHARRALELLTHAGLRVTADLIIGLPNQTRESFAQSVDEVVASGVGHISLYMLDLEEGTKLEEQVRKGKTLLPPDEEVADLYLSVIERLAAAGLEQYEISNFARRGEESRHNLAYWQRQPYAGYGLGAHEFDGAERRGNATKIDEYIELIRQRGDAVVFRERLTADEEVRERIFLALRQRRGISYADLLKFRSEEGARWAETGLREGWLRRDGERVGFTPKGFVLSNEFISQLF